MVRMLRKERGEKLCYPLTRSLRMNGGTILGVADLSNSTITSNISTREIQISESDFEFRFGGPC
jgi:hypothetical protein